MDRDGMKWKTRCGAPQKLVNAWIGEGLANIQINTDTEVIIKPQVVVTANFKPILCISLALAISSIPIANMTSTTLLPLLQ